MFDVNITILRNCYGKQMIMGVMGGKIESCHSTAEFDRTFVTPEAEKLALLDDWFEDDKEQV